MTEQDGDAMMEVRDLLNACEHFNNISIWQSQPDIYDIAFDPDDSTFLCTTDDMRTLPDYILKSAVAIWNKEDDDILIHI